MRYSKWLVAEHNSSESSETSHLIGALLKARGVAGSEDLEKFLHPKFEDLLDPFLFEWMEKSVERIWKAVEAKETIAVYADYDADAVTAAATLFRAFQYLGVSVTSRIPDRFTEGYGLNIEAFEELKKQGASLIITVDCGTNSVDVAEWCLENKIDLIITDHHEVTGDLPKAFALVNPKNPQEHYPDKQITGVGVAFKLVQGMFADQNRIQKRLADLGREHVPGWEKWLLDLVAIGTVADCHSLLGENRILVKFGLLVMQKTKWIGLSALLSLLTTSRDLTARTIGFQIAPRINAAGRLAHAGVALRLLTTDDSQEAEKLAGELEGINLKRQGLSERIFAEALEQAGTQTHREVLVLWGEDWHQGVVGIVAGRMAEKSGKPSFVLSQVGDFLTGSGRSRGDFDIVEALRFASSHLVKFGGHKQAGGLTLAKESLEGFVSAVLAFSKTTQKDLSDDKVLQIDAELIPEELSLASCELVENLAPFGMGNPEPVFLLKNAKITEVRLLGKDQNHIKLYINAGSAKVEVIGFGFAEELSWVKAYQSVDLAFHLSINEWNGKKSVNLKLVDARPAFE